MKVGSRRKTPPPDRATQTPGASTSTHRSVSRGSPAQWTFLTNHAHVLILLAQDPTRILREVAQQVGITERAVQRIIVDLEDAGILVREKTGRQNRYHIDAKLPLRHPVEAHRSIADLIQLGNVD